ncbi:ABC transporter permease [Sphingomonas sp. LB-2]|uniref:ABC transporter permease n=1 Tax=Sphingomonas caeni TaxID=2984949 RepID=UPI002231E004|nr:ABC transporter permease [Sphingomonas caeni]MCW3845613.1 ABC transporter permease [Sphingomonas caeni]
MRNLISAEWTKMLPHKGTWFLVWLYPVLFFVIFAITIMVASKGTKPETVAGWIEDTSVVWHIASISLGRYLIAGYFAVVFAGEYGWNTWKLVVPHASRWKLLGSKYLVTLGLLYIAWIATALISVLMRYLGSAVSGEALPQGLTLGTILYEHGKLLLLGIAPLLITAGYATTAAISTRSTLATVIISIVLVTLDELLGKIVQWLSSYGMEWPAIPYRILPGYHLQNLASWMAEGAGFQAKLATGTVIAYSETVSLLAIAGWVVGLAGLVLWVFRRQDIN